jgi:tetratricopeptide (TPR) repeat protein
MKPRLFIGSSVEGLNVAYAIQQNLQHQAEITVWDQSVFELSKTTIESLVQILEKSDFGIFVFSPDDEAIMRGNENKVVRDNVIFELGLYIGKLGRERSFFIIPEKTEFHLPTDLLGITAGRYEIGRSDGNFQSATGVFCQSVRDAIKKLGRIEGETTIPTEKLLEDKKDESSNNYGWIDDYLDKKYDEAIEKLKHSIKTEKENEKIVSLESWICTVEIKKDKKLGYDSFKKLQEKYIDNPKPTIRFIESLLSDDNMIIASKEIENAFLNFPNNSQIEILKSNFLVSLGNKEGAISYSREVFSKSDEPSIALNLYDLLLENDMENEAHKVIHQTFLTHPNDSNVLFKYFQFADRKGMNEVALFLNSKLINSDPEHTEYWIYRGNTCLNLNLYDYSQSSYEKGEELVKNKEAWIYSNLGNIHKHRGFYTIATKYFNQAIEIDKESEYAHNRLSETIKLRDEERKKFNGYIEEGRKLLFNLKFEKIE